MSHSKSSSSRKNSPKTSNSMDNEKPESQTCSICRDPVDADDKTKQGVPNCVSCKNGHFIHRECYDGMDTNHCPQCREPVKFNCMNAHGYLKFTRKGGKKQRKTMKKRKSRKVVLK